jgi:hypothetical protein
MDWFKSERQKRRTPIHHAQLRSTPTLPGFDARSRELYGTALPRGVLPAVAAVRLEHSDVEMIRAGVQAALQAPGLLGPNCGVNP